MKTSIVFTAFFAVIFAAQAAYVYRSTYEAHTECQVESDSHIDKSLVTKLVIGELVEGQNIGAHALCINVKLGIQKQNGDIEVETLKQYLAHLIHSDERLNQIMAKFGVRSHGSTPQEAAVTLFNGIAKAISAEHAHDEKFSEQIYSECEAKNNNHIDISAIRKVIKGESEYKEDIGAHTYCVNVKLGLQKENGDIEIEPLRRRLTTLIQDEETVNHTIAEIEIGAHGSTPNKAAIILLRGIDKNVSARRHTNIIGQKLH